MTGNGSFRYALELYDDEGASLGQAPLSIDWEPALEAARFDAVRKGELPAGATDVMPLWHPETGRPILAGFRVRVPLPRGQETHTDFSTTYFAEAAREESSRLVTEGKLEPGAGFSYRAAAYPGAPEPPRAGGAGFQVEEVPVAPPLQDGDLGELLRRAELQQAVEGDHLPVFLPPHVLSEASELARGAGGAETGGILVGHLRRDPSVPDVFAVVTAQIPAAGARADRTSLTFTAETWSQVRAVLDLRRRREVYLGWWHSHRVDELCKDCPVERRRTCALSTGFFSAHDRALHRTVFPSAYHVALVVNQLDDRESTYSFFGWHQGRLESRGFHLLDPAPGRTAERTEAQQEENDAATP